LFESIGQATGNLPIEPEKTSWSRKETDVIVASYEFNSREKSKDFVASVQELEDRMHHFIKITIEGNSVKLEEHASTNRRIPEVIEKFFRAVDRIKEDIDDFR
jgi:pterin-4a-carbinolamine dehydratase